MGVRNQSKSKHIGSDGRFYRDIKADHEDDFNAFLDSAAAFSVNRTRENYDAMRAAEKKAIQSGADYNGEAVDSYLDRCIERNDSTKSILAAYLSTGDPELKEVLSQTYGISAADKRSQEAVDAIKKRAIDTFGDNFFGRERATMLEYADPSELASTVVESALTFGAGKFAHGAVAGAKAAKTGAKIMSYADRMKKAAKAVGAVGAEMAWEGGTEMLQANQENPFASADTYGKAFRDAAEQTAIMGGVGMGVGAVAGRASRASAAKRAMESGEKLAEDLSRPEAVVGVPEGIAEGQIFIGGDRKFYRNEGGKPVAVDDSEVLKVGNGAETVETKPAEKLGYENAPVVEVPLGELSLSADVPNFKEGADAKTGVVAGQQLEGEYERVGTAPIVVWEREDGRKEVITGRHRLDLAKRSGEETIPSYIVREADGFTADDARTFDAESNIRDGMGDVRDYAHYFKNKDISEGEAQNKGLLAREKGRRGWSIGKYASDDVYGLFRNGRLSEERAAAIAKGAPNDTEVQNAALASAQGMDATTLEIHTRRLAAYKAENSVENESGTQTDLFGNDDEAMAEMVKLSKAAGELVKENKQKILAVRGVLKRPEVAREMGVDINDPDSVKAAVARLEYENARLMSPTPEPEILEKIRRKAGLFDEKAEGENIEQAANLGAQEDTASLFGDDGGAANMEDVNGRIPTIIWVFGNDNPTHAEIAEAIRQYKEIWKKYFGTPLWHKTPDGNESNLTEEQWVWVRTPNFKKWFGDWETLAIINEVRGMPAMKVVPSSKTYTGKEIDNLFLSFGVAKNNRNGLGATFPVGSSGKIIRHQGFPVESIIENFKSLFESSILSFSENEVLKEGHKQHSNYLGYEHYVNKFRLSNGDVY